MCHDILPHMSGISHPISPVQYYTVNSDHEGQRLDNFLSSYLTGVPKSKLHSIIRKGEVRINKGRAQASYRLVLGDIVRIPPIRQEPKQTTSVRPGSRVIKLLEDAILYEDDALIVLNKPEKMAVHGGSGIQFGLIEALRHSRPQARFLELVHRLDRDTSGCVMVAKRRSMLVHLHECLRTGNIEKRYYAIVEGQWRGNKVVEAPLLKYLLKNEERMVKVSPEGKFARTQFEIVESFPNATLLQAAPITGRTHQIRVHCAYMGHPILGDKKYGSKADFNGAVTRLYLHAHSLTIDLPYKPYHLTLHSPMPRAFDEICLSMRKSNAK